MGILYTKLELMNASGELGKDPFESCAIKGPAAPGPSAMRGPRHDDNILLAPKRLCNTISIIQIADLLGRDPKPIVWPIQAGLGAGQRPLEHAAVQRANWLTHS